MSHVNSERNTIGSGKGGLRPIPTGKPANRPDPGRRPVAGPGGTGDGSTRSSRATGISRRRAPATGCRTTGTNHRAARTDDGGHVSGHHAAAGRWHGSSSSSSSTCGPAAIGLIARLTPYMKDSNQGWKPPLDNPHRHPVRLYCCGCKQDVHPRLTDGTEIYPHRKDLGALPFWKCGDCGNYVGCHHKTADRTKPLGCIPTSEIRNARSHLHALIDPVWRSGRMSRGKVYDRLSKALGRRFHTADIRSVEEAREAYRIAKSVLPDA